MVEHLILLPTTVLYAQFHSKAAVIRDYQFSVLKLLNSFIPLILLHTNFKLPFCVQIDVL